MRVARFAAIAALSVLAIFSGLAPVAAEKRVALVVGNGAYQFVGRLTNPRNDAELIAKTLKGLGFTLIGEGAQIDLDKAGFDNAVQSFGAQLQGADVGLFYYAGHGLQVRGANYLVPVGANPTKEADVDFQMLDANLVLRQMEGSGTKLNVVILDACRNNPFGGRGLRAAARGLAQMQAPEGTLISYATQPGNVAQDGSDGDSPYTKALAQIMPKPGLGIFDAFNEVGLAVKSATGGSQQPWVSSSPIAGTFYFAGAPPKIGPDSENFAWNIIKDSKDAEQLQRFLQQYPNSQRRAEVEQRVVYLEDLAKTARAEAEALRVKSEAGVQLERREVSLLVQFELKRVGCFDGAVDGEFGETTRVALRNFARHSATNVPEEVSLGVAKTIRGYNKRVCPLVCQPGERSDGDRCVRISCASGEILKDGTCMPRQEAKTPAPQAESKPPVKSGKCFTFQGRQFCE